MDRILLVEDEADIRENLAELFENRSFTVFTAENGSVGYEKAREIIPDLIISDVIMPVMDGFEMLDAIKKDARTMHLPVILLTAKGMLESKVKGLEIGADDYVTKPFEFDELLARARSAINNRKRVLQKIKISPSEEDVESKDDVFLRKVIQAVEKNIDNFNFSIDDLAKEIGYSRSSIQKKIKSLTGKTTSQLIREFRLEKARQLIQQDAGFLSEIAMAVGFNSLSYFSNSYKEYFGVPPSKIKSLG
ncbi:MAG: response regulator [Bacteroidetes bacterium]|nr:MAG: response regulator [Bacteroidota bacterium]